MNEINPLLAVEFLQTTAPKFSQAKADRTFLENYLKTVKSRLMQESDSKSLGDREAFAYAHESYVEQLRGYKQAIEEEERLKWLMTAAQAKIEVWKTLEYTKRAELKNL
jgi:hypothetical protein|tara:strand:+ start:1041 stop:1367 length:327 start_codon:yes stop_codon:yes gene_type:complete